MPFPNMSLSEQWQWVKPVWRVLVAICVVQFIGMTLGILLNRSSPLFLSLWYGGAYATPIGFAIGLAWHATAVPRGISENRSILLVLGAVALMIPFFGFFAYDFLHFSPAR